MHGRLLAVLTGSLEPSVGLERLPRPGRDRWAERLNEAERAQTRDFARNGWVVEAPAGGVVCHRHDGDP
jgi:ADP-ribosyl-[dinitrogen reductase] hydrolase